MLDRRTEILLPVGAEGMPAELWLACRFTYLDLEAWREELAAGRILLEGIAIGPGEPLRGGMRLRWLAPPLAEPSVDSSWRLAYEDGDILVIDKPAGLPCHPAGRFFKNTLWAMLKERYGSVRLVSRLDRETSGLLIAAKTKEAARRYALLAAKGSVVKRYLALVHGSFPKGEIVARGWLVPDAKSTVRKKRAFIADPALDAAAKSVAENNAGAKNANALDAQKGEGPLEGAESCETRFSFIASGEGISLVQALPLTGRTHQIRASLCSLGYPVVGDKLYGLDETIFDRFARGAMRAEDEARLILPHQALHSYSIRIRGGPSVEAPPPWVDSFGFLGSAIASLVETPTLDEEGTSRNRP
jgi:23S rRNA pseudouridine955/2504/2580 synthase/23S rRNA pseudouridine1911/1915/1917 synthase